MSYEDLEKAKAERAAKKTAKEATKAEKAVKKTLREANNAEKEAKRAADEVEEAITGKSTRGQKRKRPAAVDALEPKAMVPRGSEALKPVERGTGCASGANEMRLQYGGCRTEFVCWHTTKQ
jgi:hypothetical protein